MKRHSWVQKARWFEPWDKSTRQCVRCKARVRLVSMVGPRGGRRYSYAEKGQKFGIVAHIPECSFRRAGGGPPVSPGQPSSPEGTPAVGPTERVGDYLVARSPSERTADIIVRYEGYAAEWRAKGRTKEAEAMDEIVARLKDGTATQTVA